MVRLSSKIQRKMITDIDPAVNAFWIANNMEAKRYEYDLTCEDTVIDLGAYQGEFAIGINNKYHCRVICVEPTNSCNHMNSYDWAEVINAAASIDNLPLKFGGAFYYTTLFESGENVYSCFDILELLVDQKIGLLKMNVEGMEYMLLDRILTAGLMKNIKYLQVQFHKINETTDDKVFNIRKELAKTHRQMWCVNYCWESWEKL